MPRRLALDDTAENSIMQTISIAVSAILIAAGLITAPSLINNARDTNARQDLANVAYSQDYALANTGSYADLVRYVQTLENAMPTLRWGNLQIKTTPQAPEMTLQVFVVGAPP